MRWQGWRRGDEALLLSVSVGQKGLCHCHKYFSTHQLLPTHHHTLHSNNTQTKPIFERQFKIGAFSKAVWLVGEKVAFCDSSALIYVYCWKNKCSVKMILSFLGWVGLDFTTGHGWSGLPLSYNTSLLSSRNLLHVWQVSGYLEICPRANICETSWLSDALARTLG